MKLKTSYKMRDTVLHQYMSIPQPTEKDVNIIFDHITWLAERESPTVEVIEG